MELFKDTNIDFLGRRRYFVSLSILLIVASAIGIFARGGPRLGIDFKGGTLVYVKFRDEPRTDDIRSTLSSRGFAVAALQPFEGGADSHELKIDLDLDQEQALTSGREQIIEGLRDLYGGDAGKLDFNNIGADTLAVRLSGNAQMSQSGLTRREIEQAAQELIAFRDKPPQSGLIKEFSQLAAVPGLPAAVLPALEQETYLGDFAIRGVEVVGPKIGRDLQEQAFKATLAALAAMGVYLAFRFEWVYGLAAVIAVFHDVFVTVGFFSFFDYEIDLNVIAALLTLVGYSVNDTIVIFDRVRENLKLTRRVPLETLFNQSVNQTLSRTIMTSGLTFVAVICLYLFGGPVLRGFSFALVVGVVVGSYSTIFVASPIVLWFRKLLDKRSGHPAVSPRSRTRPTVG